MVENIVQNLLDKGVLIAPELIEEGIDESLLKKAIEVHGDDLLVVDRELLANLNEKELSFKITWSYDKPNVKRTYDDFVKALNKRFDVMEQFLRNRQELSSTTSLSRLAKRSERERVSCIVMIQHIAITKNDNIIITVEDRTGLYKLLISKNNHELHTFGKDLQLDEIIGVTGTLGDGIIFADNIILPDVPLTKELKKCPEEEYAIFVSDTEFGSKNFLHNEFTDFLLWLRGEKGNDLQRKIAKKVKYLFNVGDIVAGVGVYPGQEEDLSILDITKQYEEAARFFKQVPSHITKFFVPGNHDAGRLSEPQEPLQKDFAQALYDLSNTYLLSNPSRVTVGITKTFPGIDILLYHGGSLIYYADHVASIRKEGGQKRPDLLMTYYLQRRHLAPTHESVMTIPDPKEDNLIIKTVPDIIVTGHIHRASAAQYRNVTMINSSCWTDTTESQIKRGLEPQPARVVALNLKTRKVHLLNFYRKKK